MPQIVSGERIAFSVYVRLFGVLVVVITRMNAVAGHFYNVKELSVVAVLFRIRSYEGCPTGIAKCPKAT